MVAKLVVLLGSIMAVTRAGILPGHFAAAPVPVPAVPVAKASTDYDPYVQYGFAYSVQDDITGDSKSQHETREGDVVSGSYSLVEADGTRRIVEYRADPINGFVARVLREPAVVKAIPTIPASVPVDPAPAVAKVSPFLGHAPSYFF